MNYVFFATLIGVLVVIFLAFRNPSQNSCFANLTVEDFKDKMNDSSVVILDVRTPAEVAQGAIAGAINIDVTATDFATRVAALDKTKTYLVYCRSGVRSVRACNTLCGQGFEQVNNLVGGYLAWK